ncbi:MAG: hypothetical protein Q9214_005213 [Letrouitia sp. 1 TL-2023]
MLIEGEKYACEACVRGHRVSNCQHSDRPLIHINKKGRPVSQCPHCRGLRKARASHVKCECGEKPHAKEECTDRGSQSKHGDNKADSIPVARPLEAQSCCCSHGSRCTCALKKEYLESVPEVGLPKPSPPLSLASKKPRLPTNNSDSLMHFANGHHKPVHKLNDAHNKLGAPYKIPIPHSISGNQDLAQRSSDSLPLVKTLDQAPPHLRDSISSAHREARQVRSEHGSPKPRTSQMSNHGLPSPLDLSYPSFPDINFSPMADQFSGSYPPSRRFDTYFAAQDEAPAHSPGISMPAEDWSTFDPPIGHGAYSTGYNQPASYATFDPNNTNQPGVMNSPSGDVSDIDELLARAEPKTSTTSSACVPQTSPEIVAGETYRNEKSPSYLSQPPSDVASEFLSASSSNSLEIEDYVPKTTASPTEFEDPSAGVPMGSEKFAKHGLTVQDAQKLAHPGPPTDELDDLSIPSKPDNSPGPWAVPFDAEEAVFTPEGGTPNMWAR